MTDFGNRLRARRDRYLDYLEAVGLPHTGRESAAQLRALLTAAGYAPDAVPVAPAPSVLTNREALWLPTGVLATNYDPQRTPLTGSQLTSGRMQLASGLVIPKGVTVTNIDVYVGASAAGVGITNAWVALLSRAQNPGVIAKSADKGSANGGSGAIATNGTQRFTFDVPFTPTVDTAYYVGVVFVGTTIPYLLSSQLFPTGTTGPASAYTPKAIGYAPTAYTDPASLGANLGSVTTDSKGFNPAITVT